MDRDKVEPKHFESWIQWAAENDMKLDFNSTSFSHPKSGNLTLSNPDKSIRDFWIEHTKRCRRIADAMGKAQNDPCIMNIWVHDGSKDMPVQRKKYREILAASLDEIMEEKLDVFAAGAGAVTRLLSTENGEVTRVDRAENVKNVEDALKPLVNNNIKHDADDKLKDPFAGVR